MIKNNGFTRDGDETRLERLLLMSHNIDTYSAELGISGDRLTWAQGAGAAWESALAISTVEDGEMDEAFETYHNSVVDAYDYFTQARELLMAFITEFENPNDLAHAYGFDGRTPRTGKGLVNAISAWKECHDRMNAAGEEPVVNDTIMTQLLEHEQILKDLSYDAEIERRESRAAYKAKALLFAVDSKHLTIIHNLAKFTWCDDDPKLRELGFCPSSEIWTPGQPPLDWPDWPGPVEASAEQIDEGLVRLTYSGLNGGKTLRIDRLKQGEADYVLVTQGLPLDDPEEVMPFDDNHLEKKKYTYS